VAKRIPKGRREAAFLFVAMMRAKSGDVNGFPKLVIRKVR